MAIGARTSSSRSWPRLGSLLVSTQLVASSTAISSTRSAGTRSISHGQKLKVGLEADGGIHQKTRCYTRDRRRDAWLREHGWLMFRVDIENRALLPSQIRRVLDVVRAMART